MKSSESELVEEMAADSARSIFVRHLAMLVLAVLWGLPALAQSQPLPTIPVPTVSQPLAGTISGTVVDKTGAAISGAHVTLIREDRSLNRDGLTDSDGQFLFANISPGDFQITVTAEGFASLTSSGTVHPGEVFVAPPSTLAPATANTALQVVATQNDIAEAQVKLEEKQRILGFVPNFYVSYDPDPVPLSTKQKFELASRTMIDPATLIMTGVTAGVQQEQNDFSGYGQGVRGYAKRSGASYVDNATDTFIGGAILPSLLKQDPRYFYKGTGSTRSRILYAIANLVVCKGDNKRWQPNYSGILGGLASGGISNLYYPAKDRGWALTFDNALIGMGAAAGVNILQEFVIRRFTPNVPAYVLSKP